MPSHKASMQCTWLCTDPDSEDLHGTWKSDSLHSTFSSTEPTTEPNSSILDETTLQQPPGMTTPVPLCRPCGVEPTRSWS